MDSNSPIPPRPAGPPRLERPVERIVTPAPALVLPAQAAGMNVGDVYYVLFRHKWKIIICAFLGAVMSVVFYLKFPPPFQSQARLFVRYVVTGAQVNGPEGDTTNTKSPDMRGETIMDSEEEILTSFDLSKRVAEAVGPEKILAGLGGGNDPVKAAVMVQRGLVVDVPRNTSVIQITFSHPDAAVVQPVLAEIVSQYLKTHVEIHRAVGIIGDFLIQETDQLRNRLGQTEEDLRNARNKAGVISLDDSKKELTTRMARIQDELLSSQAELVERSSIINRLTGNHASAPDNPANPAAAAPTDAAVTPTAGPAKSTASPVNPPAKPPAAEATAEVPQNKREQYRSLLERTNLLRKRKQDLLLQFTEENSRVKDVRDQLGEIEKTRQQLEAEYPKLAIPDAPKGETATPAATAPGMLDLATESARLVALQARIKVLNSQLDQIRLEASNLDKAEGPIRELLRKKDLEEANYRYYAARLEQSRINEALGSGKVSNISQIQTPTPPARDRSKSYKIVGGILFGGLALGFAWAFAIEMLLDRSVRRPIDVEKMLGLPLFLSIPALEKNGGPRRFLGRRKGDRTPAVVPANGADGGAPAVPLLKNYSDLARMENGALLHTFHETLRDRLISYFESRNLTHKPKLVAVTGLDRASGVTTIAAGLASCLSETGEGNVLLVDMTAGQGSAQQFYRGKEICGLDDILSTRDSAQVQDKLYVVAEEPGRDRLSRILPQRFNKLVPKLKASNFDYIIFDMPPVSQISITPRLAGFMDMVLLVIESEKTDRELVQRATALLAQSKAQVGAVLNKSRNYVPKALLRDSLDHI